MNLKARGAELPSLKPVLKSVEDEIQSLVPAEFIPPRDRTEQMGRLTLNAVDSFAELPTKELDSLLAGIKAKITEIEGRANAIKADYMARTAELKAAIERLNEACRKGEIKMEELHAQLNEIYQPKAAAAAVAEEPRQ
jgi:hypothetical protein